jgi:hypothetical protein
MSGFRLLTRYIQLRQLLVLILLIVHFIVFRGLCVSSRTYSYTWNQNYAQHNTQYTKKKPRTNIGLHHSPLWQY